jgi:hypothetical protein
MRRRESQHGLTVNAIAGTHVVTLGLNLSDAQRKDCLGFSIQREDHTEQELTWLRGMKTFAETDPGLGAGGTASSREHPFQAFQWADYAAKPEHKYTYKVVPYYGTPRDREQHRTISVTIRTESEQGDLHSVFFNRGAVASQEYARQFGDKKPNKQPDARRQAAYDWLSRGLFEALVEFIERANGPAFELYGAVYEFQWHPALEALRDASATGAKMHVLYDGIPGKGKPAADNLEAINKVGIGAFCQARTTGTLMHNKFFVLVRDGAPVAVWTGSTNLTENGIFGHLNCGHSVESPELAQAYLEYWHQLAGQPGPDSKTERAWIGQHNPSPPDPWSEDITHVFSPHTGLKVLDWYAMIAEGAQQALFMTFAFGMDERFQKIYDLPDGKLRIALMDKEGSGSTLKEARREIGRIRRKPNVLVAVGKQIKTNQFDRWLAERSGLTQGVQWVHTKFMLVDPLSTSPIVVTGSANFSPNSTNVNNENMLVIRGNERVADIYLGEFLRTYSHYAFREAVALSQVSPDEWTPQHLATTPAWQDQYYTPGNDRDLRRRYFAGSS